MNPRPVARAVRELATMGTGPTNLRELLDGPHGDSLVDALEHHRLVGYAHAALGGFDDLPVHLADRLTTTRVRGLQVHLRALADLARLRDVLDGITWLVIKGPVLAEGLHGDFSVRPYRDLDILVPPDRFGDVVDRLERDGARMIDRNWRLLHDRVAGEVHLVLPNGSLGDVHWHLLHDADERAPFNLPTRPMLERRVTADVGGVAVSTLDPADTILHLALHACLAGGDRLVWACDLRQAIAVGSPPWSTVVTRATTTRTHLAVAGMLAVAARYGAVVPAPVHADLDPEGRWTRLVRLVIELHPPERLAGDGSPGRLVCRSTRDTWHTSVKALLARVRGYLATPGRARDRARAVRSLPSHPGSAVHADGGVTERRAFVQAVIVGHPGSTDWDRSGTTVPVPGDDDPQRLTPSRGDRVGPTPPNGS